MSSPASRVLRCVLPSLLLLAPGPALAEGRAATGAGVWPLSPPVVRAAFAPPAGPYGAGHRGVDLGGRPGQPVRAAMAGTVSFRGQVAGRPVVVVDHGTTRTTYEPVVAGVARGTAVGAGEVIGTLTTLGSHCAPAACLHWGWRRGEVYLDPLLLLGGWTVRLLPWDDAARPPAAPAAPAVPAGPAGPPGPGVTGSVSGTARTAGRLGLWLRARW